MKERKKKSESARKFPKFGILDAVILLLLIAAVVGIYFRYNIMDTITKNKNLQEYAVTFSVKEIRYTTPNYVSVGDKVYFADSGDLFGTLLPESDSMSEIALSVTPSSEYFVDDGQIVEVFYPNNESRVDARGRIQCKGSLADNGGFLLDGSVSLAPGQKVNIRTDSVTISVEILKIELFSEG